MVYFISSFNSNCNKVVFIDTLKYALNNLHSPKNMNNVVRFFDAEKQPATIEKLKQLYIKHNIDFKQIVLSEKNPCLLINVKISNNYERHICVDLAKHIFGKNKTLKVFEIEPTKSLNKDDYVTFADNDERDIYLARTMHDTYFKDGKLITDITFE